MAPFVLLEEVVYLTILIRTSCPSYIYMFVTPALHPFFDPDFIIILSYCNVSYVSCPSLIVVNPFFPFALTLAIFSV